MPRVKGKPKQNKEILSSVFTNNDEITSATEKPAIVSNSPDLPAVTTDTLRAFSIISKAIESGEFPLFPRSGGSANQPATSQGPENSSSPPLPLFFLPERVATQPVRERDREVVVCTVCQKSMRRGSLREHMDRHENTGKFECELCGKTFSRASAREKHIRTHTGERPFKCDLCPKAYRQKVHLNEHMRSHSGERPFVCRLCGFSLASKSLLNRHLRTHGVKNGCNEAPDMWLRTDAPKSQVLAAAGAVGLSIDVEKRVSGATGDDEDPETIHVTALNAMATAAALRRKHLCPECPAGFPTMQALRSHRMTTHGLVVQHVCNTCGTTFTSSKTLKIHMRTDHPQICPLCQQKMPQRKRWVLELHIQEKHPEVSPETVLGPSPLSASSSSKRRSSRKERLAQKRLCLAQASQSNGNIIFKELPKGVSTNGDSEVTGSNNPECISEGDGENSLLSTLNHLSEEESDGKCHDPSFSSLKLQIEPLSRQAADDMSNQPIISVD